MFVKEVARFEWMGGLILAGLQRERARERDEIDREIERDNIERGITADGVDKVPVMLCLIVLHTCFDIARM